MGWLLFVVVVWLVCLVLLLTPLSFLFFLIVVYICTSNSTRHHEPLLCSYIGFQALNLFVVNYFNRVFIVANDIKDVRQEIAGAHMDPRSLAKVRGEITALAGDITLLEEILAYISESLEVMPVPPEPPEQAGRSLYSRLQIQDQKVRVGHFFCLFELCGCLCDLLTFTSLIPWIHASFVSTTVYPPTTTTYRML